MLILIKKNITNFDFLSGPGSKIESNLIGIIHGTNKIISELKIDKDSKPLFRNGSEYSEPGGGLRWWVK